MADRRNEHPRVSVGLAVYNGEKYVEATIASILEQSFTDLELIVSDNASTDSTPEIIEKMVRSDSRVRSHRFAANKGPALNYNKTVDMATGEFFMWSAADDLRAPSFIERCVHALDTDPGAVLAYSRTRIIDGDGCPVMDWEYDPDVGATDPHTRLRNLVLVNHKRHGAFEIFGLIRKDALDAAMPLAACARADSVMLARLALRGRFHRIPDHLFFNRDHSDRSVRSTPKRAYGGRGVVVERFGSGPIPADEWWDASKRDRIVWPEWNVLREYERAVANAPLSDAERRACMRVIAEFATKHTLKLTRDVLINTEYVVRRLLDARRAA